MITGDSGSSFRAFSRLMVVGQTFKSVVACFRSVELVV